MGNFISVKLEGFDEAMAMFDHQVARAAAYSAINRSVDGLVTDVSSEVRTTYNIRKQDIDKRIKKFKCSDYYDLKGWVEIKGGVNDYTSAIPLIMFGATGRQNLATKSVKTMKGKYGYYSKEMKRQGKAGVSYKVLQSGGKGYSSKAFIMPGARGSLQVVRRTGTGRMAFKEMRAITPASMVASSKHGVVDRVIQKATERFQKNFKSNLLYYMDQARQGNRVGGMGWQDKSR